MKGFLLIALILTGCKPIHPKPTQFKVGDKFKAELCGELCNCFISRIQDDYITDTQCTCPSSPPVCPNGSFPVLKYLPGINQ